MNYIDQHMHTYFSFDSEEKFEEYLKLTDGKIITTEHLDLINPYFNNEDTPLDLEMYDQTIDDLNKKYDNRILKGIEVGFSTKNYKRVLQVLDTYAFDSVLLSCHYNDKYDYMDTEVDYDKTPSVLIPGYLNNLITAVKTIGDKCHVLTHFDYGFRIADINAKDLEKYGEDLLLELINELINKNMSVELNSKSIYAYDKLALYEYFVPLYIKNGGTEFVLGSDAHRKNEYKHNFKNMLEYLDSLGVEYINEYINQKPNKVSIKALLKD